MKKQWKKPSLLNLDVAMTKSHLFQQGGDALVDGVIPGPLGEQLEDITGGDS